MRIGTAYAQQQAVDAIGERQSRLLETQLQIGSGKRVNRPSDDPVAAAEAERLRSRDSRIQAEQRAAERARTMLSSADNALGDATELMQSARELLLAAGNGTSGANDRAAQATQLQQIRDQLMSVANRGDGAGGFVFGGQGTASQPVPEPGTAYAALAGSQLVGSEMPVGVTLDGRENFTAIRRSGGGTESIFARLDAAVSALRDPAATTASVSAATRATIDSVDLAIDRFGLTRTVVGERLKALDAHGQALERGSIDNQARLSELVDVDIAKSVSSMVQQQTAVEAAMKSYAQIARMSLFQYL
jgi:flagellar hook-associated protein 3 FlgL